MVAKPTTALGLAPAEGEHAGKWTVLGIVALGVFMATLDSSVVNISLPTIARHFGRPLDTAMMWVVIAYLVVVASLMLTIGRLADVVGHKPIWILGLAVFTIGSALCGAAPSLASLIAFRSVQGVGGAMLMAISPAMLTAAFPPAERGRAIGLNSLFVAAGVSAGPTLGGLITEHLSWRWIFYVNVPVGIVAVLVTLRRLIERRQRQAQQFDPAGALLLGTGLAALIGALSLGGPSGWTAGPVVSAAIVAVVALLGFVLVEPHVRHPILDFELFRSRVFASGTISLALSFTSIFAVGFMMPFYLEELRHFSTGTSGLLLTPYTLVIALVAPGSGALADRFGTRWLAAAGMTIACVGLVLLGSLDASAPKADVIWRLGLTGLGQGMFQSPNNSAILGAVPVNRQGVASGILATGRVVGQCLSVAIAGAVFSSLGGASAGRGLATAASPEIADALRVTFLHAFRATLWVSAALAPLAAPAPLIRGKEARPTQFVVRRCSGHGRGQ
jgi:EmrB/QacA subfamily drug resistance transporter